MKSIIDSEDMMEGLRECVVKYVFKPSRPSQSPHPRDVDRWIEEHKDDLVYEIDAFVGQAVWRVQNPDKAKVAAPVIDIKTKGGDGSGSNICVWVYDAHQGCALSEQRSFQFGHDNRAGLVYETKDSHGHQAIDYNIDKDSVWQWIQKWMKIGLHSKGFLNEPVPDHEG